MNDWYVVINVDKYLLSKKNIKLINAEGGREKGRKDTHERGRKRVEEGKRGRVEEGVENYQ